MIFAILESDPFCARRDDSDNDERYTDGACLATGGGSIGLNGASDCGTSESATRPGVARKLRFVNVTPKKFVGRRRGVASAAASRFIQYAGLQIFCQTKPGILTDTAQEHLSIMGLLTFVLRIRNTRFSFSESEGFRASMDYQVRCVSLPDCFSRPTVEVATGVDGGRSESQAWFTEQGWVEYYTSSAFKLEWPLPLSAHELLEKSQDVLTRYWSREELLEAFQQVNATCR